MVKSPRDLIELLAQLKRHEVTDIVGVVGPLGAWATEIPGSAQNLMFTLEPWRHVDGAVQDRKLTIRSTVNETTLRSALMLIKALDVVRVRARVAEVNAFGTPQGEFVELVAVMYDGDAELDSRAKKLGRPVRVKDDRFGLLTLDRRFNWFENDATWKSDEVVLRLSMSGCGNIERLMSLAHTLWDSQDKWDQAIRECAVTGLLELKNENWLADDEEESPPKSSSTESYRRDRRVSHRPSLHSAEEFDRYRSVADMAGLGSGPTPSLMTHKRHAGTFHVTARFPVTQPTGTCRRDGAVSQ